MERIECTDGYALKACPYCGKEDFSQIEYTGTFQAWGVETCQVVCLNCGTRGPYENCTARAAGSWNRMPRNEP